MRSAREVNQFLSEIKQIDYSRQDAKWMLQSYMKNYEKQILQNNHPQNQVQIPTELQINQPVLADGSLFGHYQGLLKQSLFVDPAKIEPYVQKGDPQNQFLRYPYSDPDQQSNTLPYNRFRNWNSTYPNEMKALMDNSSSVFYAQQLQLMNVNAPKPEAAPDPEKEFLQRMSDNINKLGGIEDTIGIMHQSLKDFEISHMTQRQYKQLDQYSKQNNFSYYPNDQQILQEQGICQMCQMTNNLELTQGVHFQQQRHPFHHLIEQQKQENQEEIQMKSEINKELSSIAQSKLLRQKREQLLNQKNK